MKAGRFYLVFALLVTTAVLACPAPATSGDLFTFTYDIGAHGCDGRSVQRDVGGPSDAIWYIVKMELWRGMSVNAVADFWLGVTLNDGRFMGGNNWDRYARTSGMHTMMYDYAPHYFRVPVGGRFWVDFRCTDEFAWGGLPARSVGHGIMTIWYTYSAPRP